MAILYGTTADGDSLPVEVNEFGQLVAQGLPGEPGQPGPPGPPGTGELPPDPSNGDILVWENDQLAWQKPSSGMQIRQIQRGITALSQNNAELLVSISVVDPAKSVMSYLGFTAGNTTAAGGLAPINVSLNSGSRVLISRGQPGIDGKKPPDLISWELTEYL